MRFIFLAVVAVTCIAAAPAHGRLFHMFDFEERQLGNDEDLPMHWAKVAGRDLPHYVVGRLTTDAAHGGRYSFRMDLDGGNCIYQYDTDRLPVAVGGHYRVTGFCRTTPLPHARGRLAVAVVDADGAVLAESASDPYAGDDWRELSAEVTADDPRAAQLRVRMELVQPARLSPATAPNAIVAEDVRGSAWFDDLTVAQVPRVAMSTARPGNVFRRGDAAAVSVLVADPSTDDLTAQLAVTDVDGRAVYQHTGTVSLTAAEPAGAGRYRLAMPLPVTAAGWYRATVRFATPGDGNAASAALSGAASLDYVQLADDGAIIPPDARFATADAALPATTWPAVAEVLPLLSAGRAKLPFGADANALDAMLDRLDGHHITAVGCLPVASTDATAVVLSRHVGHVDQWQIGADDTDAFATDPAARRTAARVATVAAGLTKSFALAVPCPLGFDPPTGWPSAVWVPASVLPSEIGPYLADRANVAAVASVSLQPLDAGRFDPAARAADLAQRIVSALAAGAARVDVPVPLTATAVSPLADPERSTVEPTDLFLVERTLLTAVAGAACRGRVPLADGVEAVLFERPDGVGVAVLWADGGTPEGGRAVPVQLGADLTRIDLSGNVTPLPADPAALRVGSVPTIVTGIDVPRALLRAGLAWDAPTVESVLLKAQSRRLHLTNPYRQPLTGTVRLRGPAGWTLSPPTLTVSLAPGESADFGVNIDLPVNARAGRNLIVADVDAAADAVPVRLSVPVPMAVGLADVGVQSSAFREGGAVVVQQRITNYGPRPIDYVAYAVCPGRPREERLVTALPPGRTTLKRYRFADVGPDAVTLKAGVRESDGPRVLNELVTVR